MNNSFSDLDSILQLSKDTETLGFDLVAGQTWIYPTNYQVRDYQYNITQAALQKNTLVSLPTGLGKTFIAAVVMYNFYRWYPLGKIIFMAPTKPLVKQQQDACYNITAIPSESTAEMTGNKVKTSRMKIWKDKRVFFITPQILQNDIDVVLNLAEQIKCIVIDEAHRALGKNANCEAIKKIHSINKYFRVLALSATPGNNFNSVKDVITNLLISHIEVRTNESIDVAPYVFQRKLETFIIPITGELLAVKNKYIMILDKYTRPLLQFNIFSGNCANLTKGRIVLTMKEFKEKGRHHNKYGFILKTLNLCVTLYHGYELLIRHGLRGFLVFFDGTTSKPLINSIQELPSVLDDVRNYLGPQEEVAMLPDGSIPELEGPIKYSHPKFEKLRQILINHYNSIEDGDTRVMVFCEYRESVMEIYQMLLRERPLVKPRVFLGQGAISQAQQLQAVKQFKSGTCNTLISTCIGEEGLDVGEVDLIVCFDISSKSPIRMVQRMGRTGRKRDGRVVVLVTEGKEQQLLSDCLVQKNNMISILESQPIKQHLISQNPKMIPENIQLRCNKMFITVQKVENPKKKEASKKKTKEKKTSNTLKTMFDNIASQSSTKNSEESESAFKTNKQKSPQKGLRTSKKNQKTPQKNQMDLRNMFLKINNTQNSLNTTQTSQQEISVVNSELTKLTTDIKRFINETIINNSSICKLCEIFENRLLCDSMNSKVSTEWKKPNLSILNSITSESLTKFSETFTKANNCSTRNQNSTTLNVNSFGVQNKSLEFFKLESTSDVFSEDSKSPESVPDPFFDHTLGMFDPISQFYHSPYKVNETQNTNQINVINNTKENEKNLNNTDLDDVIMDSEPESCSPILCTQRFANVRERIQRKLFTENETQEKIELKTCIKDKSNECATSLKINDKSFSSPLIKANFNNKHMSTPKNKSPPKNQNDTEFWDESLFKVCNSDDSLFEDDCIFDQKPENCEKEKTDNDKNNSAEQKCIEKEDSDILFEEDCIIVDQNCEKEKTDNNSVDQKSIEKQDNNESGSDSDATLILSLDTEKILKEFEKKNLQCKDAPIKLPESNENTTNKSLLSVTQAVELLNQSNLKSPNTSYKVTELTISLNNQTLQKQTLDNTANSITVRNTNQIEKETSNVNKDENKIDFDDLEISQLFENFEDDSEEEFSLLSFSQRRKRKLQLKNVESNNNAKLIKLCEKNTQDKLSNNLVLNKNENLTCQSSNKNFENKKVSQSSPSVFTFQSNKNLVKNVMCQSSDTNLENKKSSQSSSNVFKFQSSKNIVDNVTCQSSNKNLENKNPTQSSSKENHGSEEEVFSLTTKKLRTKKFKLATLKNNKPNNTINNTQSSPIKPSKKIGNNCKKPIVISDSDDDFEERPALKPLSKLITPSKKVERSASVPSYSRSNDNTQKHSNDKNRNQSYPSKKKTTSKKKTACLFIDDEAEVEDDEHYVSDSNSETEYGELDNSFVSYTQNVLDETDMRAKYLQSIRSPKFKPGAFKMPHRLPPQLYENVFSQKENIENDTYMNDSFCVGNDQTLTERDGMSYLEMIEDELEKNENNYKKRKRIITISDSD